MTLRLFDNASEASRPCSRLDTEPIDRPLLAAFSQNVHELCAPHSGIKRCATLATEQVCHLLQRGVVQVLHAVDVLHKLGGGFATLVCQRLDPLHHGIEVGLRVLALQVGNQSVRRLI